MRVTWDLIIDGWLVARWEASHPPQPNARVELDGQAFRIASVVWVGRVIGDRRVAVAQCRLEEVRS